MIFSPYKSAVAIEIQSHSIGIALLKKNLRGQITVKRQETATFPNDDLLLQPETIDKNISQALSAYGRRPGQPPLCLVNIPARHTFLERHSLPPSILTFEEIQEYVSEQFARVTPLDKQQREDDWIFIREKREIILLSASSSWIAAVHDVLARHALIPAASEPDAIACHRAIVNHLPAAGAAVIITAVGEELMLLLADKFGPFSFLVSPADSAALNANILNLIRFAEAAILSTPATIFLALPASRTEQVSQEINQIPLKKQTISCMLDSSILTGLALRGLNPKTFFISGKT